VGLSIPAFLEKEKAIKQKRIFLITLKYFTIGNAAIHISAISAW